MGDGFEIDLDGEQVLFDGAWYSKEELARKIKTMVDGGDYRIARPSTALEGLQSALMALKTLSVRLPAELAEAVANAAARAGQPVGAFVRDTLQRSVQYNPQPTQAGQPAVARPAALPLSSPIPMLTPIVPAAEPAAAPPELESPISLPPKRREEPLTDSEKGWFNRR